MKRPNLRTYRRAVQISVALAFVIIPLLNHLRISFVYGNFLAFNLAGIPLADPLAVLQITLKNNYLSADLLIGAAIALVLAAVLGTVFCSWICPFGLLSEWAQKPAGYQQTVRQKRRSAGRWDFAVKLVVLGLGLPLFLLFSTTPVLNQLSLPAWYSRIFQIVFEQGHISLAIAALGLILTWERIFQKRLWCRYICPQSVLISLAKQTNPWRLKISFRAEACICEGRRDPCASACSLALDPKGLRVFPETDCTNCGDCVVACKQRGRALSFQFRR